MNLLEGNLAICTHHYGEDPFAEISTMLWNAFLNATCTGLEGIHRQQRVEASAMRLLRAKEPIGSDAVDRLYRPGNDVILEELGHDARAFARIDLENFP
jgi:hypothetical protein